MQSGCKGHSLPCQHRDLSTLRQVLFCFYLASTFGWAATDVRSAPVQSSQRGVLDAKYAQQLTTGSCLKATNLGLRDIRDLSGLNGIHKVDLSGNCLSALGGARQLDQVVWLSLANNSIESSKVVSGLTTLRVLNLAHNKIESLEGLGSCRQLKALLLNNNALSRIEGPLKFANLATLILSNNRMHTISDESLGSLQHLTKISLAHNNMTAFPNTVHHTKLKELRLGYNNIKLIGPSIKSNTALETLDLGHNLITDREGLRPLKDCPSLKNLNLAGNPICEDPGYKDQLLQLCSSLEVLDGRRIRSKQKLKSVSADPREVFISNLPYDATERHVQQFFLDLGKRPVVKVQLLRKKTSKLSKGSAFVKFRTPEMAKIACDKFSNKTMACADRDGGVATRQVFVRATWRDVHGKPLRQMDIESIPSDLEESSDNEAIAKEGSEFQQHVAPPRPVQLITPPEGVVSTSAQIGKDDQGGSSTTTLSDNDSSLFDVKAQTTMTPDVGSPSKGAELTSESSEAVTNPALLPRFRIQEFDETEPRKKKRKTSSLKS